MAQFLFTSFFYSLDITDDRKWQSVRNKLQRDYPWLLTEKHNVYFSGIGQGWYGWRHREGFSSHAAYRARARSRVNALLSWLTHVLDAVRLAGKGPLVVVAVTPEAGLGAAVLKLFLAKRIRLVVRVMNHGASQALHVKQDKLEFRVVDWIERFVLKKADLVLPMGKFTLNLAVSKGAKREQTLILPFPVLWNQRAEIINLPVAGTILFVGRLVQEKGVDVLLRAVALLQDRFPAARVRIAGDGKYRVTFEKTAELLGISDKVVFLGWLDAERLMKEFKESAVLVMPSIVEEGMGMVLVEAGLMGRPVVASEIGGVPDIVRHQENGLLVPPGSSEALASAIAEMLQDREKARSMGLAGNRLARQYIEGWNEAVARVHYRICSHLTDETI